MASFFDPLRSYIFGRGAPQPAPEIEQDVEQEEAIIEIPDGGYALLPEEEPDSDEEQLIEGMYKLSIDDSPVGPPMKHDLLPLEDFETKDQPPVIIELGDGATEVFYQDDDTRIEIMDVADAAFETTEIPPDRDTYIAYLASAIKSAMAFVNRDSILPEAFSEKLRKQPATKYAVAGAAAALDIGAVFVFEEENKGKTVSNILKKLAVRILRPLVANKALFIRLSLYILATGVGFGLNPVIGAAFARAGFADLGVSLGGHVFKIITGFVQKSLFLDVSSWKARTRKAEAVDDEDSDEEGGPSKPGPYAFSKEGKYKAHEEKLEAVLDKPLSKLQDKSGIPYGKVIKTIDITTAVTTVAASAVDSGSFLTNTLLAASRKDTKRSLLDKPKLLHIAGHVLANGVAALIDFGGFLKLPFSVFKVVSGFSATIITIVVKKEMKDQLEHVPLLWGSTIPKVRGVKDLPKIAKRLATIAKAHNMDELATMAKQLQVLIESEEDKGRAPQTKRLEYMVESSEDPELREMASTQLAASKDSYLEGLTNVSTELSTFVESATDAAKPALETLPDIAAMLMYLVDVIWNKKQPQLEKVPDLKRDLEAIATSIHDLPALTKLPKMGEKLQAFAAAMQEPSVQLIEIATLAAEKKLPAFHEVVELKKQVKSLELKKLDALLDDLIALSELPDLSRQISRVADMITDETLPPLKDLANLKNKLETYAEWITEEELPQQKALAPLLAEVTHLSEIVDLLFQVKTIADAAKKKELPPQKEVTALEKKVKAVAEHFPDECAEIARLGERITSIIERVKDMPDLAKQLDVVLAILKNSERKKQIKKVSLVSGSGILATIMNAIVPGSSPAQITTEVFTGSLKPAFSHMKLVPRYITLPILVAGGYIIEHVIPFMPLGTILGGVGANTAVNDITSWMNDKEGAKQKRQNKLEKADAAKDAKAAKKADKKADKGDKKADKKEKAEKPEKGEKKEKKEKKKEKETHLLSFEEFTERRNFIFDGIKRISENPWQASSRLNNFIRDHFKDVPKEVLASSELDSLHMALKSILLPQITGEMEPALVTVTKEDMQAKRHAIDFTKLDIYEKGLVTEWSRLFSDFGAAAFTYGRMNIEKLPLFVNGEQVTIHARLIREGLTFEVKTAYICKALLEKVESAYPDLSQDVLRRVVAETVLVGAVDINPISRHSHLLTCFSQFDAARKDSYAMQQTSERACAIQFTTDPEGVLQARLTVSQAFQLMDTINPDAVFDSFKYTSDISKSFKDFSADWTGTITKERAI